MSYRSKSETSRPTARTMVTSALLAAAKAHVRALSIDAPLFTSPVSQPWQKSTACDSYGPIVKQPRLPAASCTDEWIKSIERQVCEAATLPCNITCEVISGMTHYRFPAGVFELSQQVWLNANTIIEGAGDPNPGMQETYQPRQKPDADTNTFFVAMKKGCTPTVQDTPTVRRGDAPYGAPIKCVRKGFLMNTNTWVKRINLQGLTENGPHFKGGLNGGGAFELPGCISPYNNGKAGGCSGADASYVTGDGKGVQNVLIEDIRMNDLLDEDYRHPFGYPHNGNSSVTVFWSGMTPDDSAHKNIKLRRIYSGATYRDGANVHGNVQDFLGEDLHFEHLGDDAFPIWGAGKKGNTIADNITFRRVTGWYPNVFDAQFGNCVQLFGVRRSTYDGVRCCGSGSWRPSWNKGDPDLYQGHAFVFWNGFDGDFSDAQVTVNDLVWQFSKNGTSRCPEDDDMAVAGLDMNAAKFREYVKGGNVLYPQGETCGLPQASNERTDVVV